MTCSALILTIGLGFNPHPDATPMGHPTGDIYGEYSLTKELVPWLGGCIQVSGRHLSLFDISDDEGDDRIMIEYKKVWR